MTLESTIKSAQAYALGVLALLFGVVATAIVYVAGNGFFDTTTGVDLERAASWFRDVLPWVGIGASCVLSTLVVNGFLEADTKLLWGWPPTVFLLGAFIRFLLGGNAHTYVLASVQVVGAVAFGLVFLFTGVALVLRTMRGNRT